VPARKNPAPGWPAGIPIPDFLTKKEACTYLRISRTKFYHLEKDLYDKAGRLMRKGLEYRDMDGTKRYEKRYLDQRFAPILRSPDGKKVRTVYQPNYRYWFEKYGITRADWEATDQALRLGTMSYTPGGDDPFNFQDEVWIWDNPMSMTKKHRA
jgi:hypothetical protein